MIHKIRNIGIIAHIDAGKTTTTERLLFFTGKSHKLGEVDQGTATMDWMEQEQNRGITITSAATTVEWKDTKINIIDTPGHVDFTIEVERSLKVLDGAIGVFCAVGGVEPQSETVWRQSLKYHVPKIAYINKLDRLGADFYHVLADIEKKLSIKTATLFIPIGAEKNFEGIIDILTQEEIHWNADDNCTTFHRKEIRESLKAQAQEYYQKLIDNLSDISSEIADLYLQEKPIPSSLLIDALKSGVLKNSILPVFCGSSLKNIGIQPLLDGIITLLPSPDMVTLPPIHNEKEEVISINENHKNLLAMVFKTEVHKNYGLLLFTRVYRGSIKQGEKIYDHNSEKSEAITRILKMHSHKTEEVSQLGMGEIGVLIGPKHTRTGHCISNAAKPQYLFEPLVAPAPVISSSIEVNNLSDRDKLLEVLEKISIEDPSFNFKEDENTGQLVISGMGELHLDVVCTRIKDDYQVPVRQGKPQVNYREGITQTHKERYSLQDHQHSTHQSIEKNVNIIIEMEVSPTEKGKGNCFEYEIDVKTKNTANLNSNKKAKKQSSDEVIAHPIEDWIFFDIKKAISSSMHSGITYGYPIIDTKIVVSDIIIEGEIHHKDFIHKYAATQALHTALKNASPTLLEPIMKLVVTTPQEYMGDAMNSINSTQGIVHKVDNNGIFDIIYAEAPMRELFGYSTILRNVTQGRATFSLEFAYYAPTTLA